MTEELQALTSEYVLANEALHELVERHEPVLRAEWEQALNRESRAQKARERGLVAAGFLPPWPPTTPEGVARWQPRNLLP